MSEDKSQKTEKATPKRRRDARKEGQIAKSQDLYGWIAVLVATFVVPLFMSVLGSRLAAGFDDIKRVAMRPDEAVMSEVAISLVFSVAVVLSLLLLASMLVSLVVTLAQVGFVVSGKPIKPKLERISINKGLKRLFSVRTAWQAVTGIVKMAAVGLVSIPLLYGVAGDLLGGMQFDLREAISYVGTNTLHIIRITAAMGLVIGAADYAFQRWRTEKDMMMSRHDIKQEHKNSEGDPHVKARQRSNRMAMSRNRMIASVGDADVVITNPTHVAVALRYRPETGAPRVLARGGDAVAARIRHEARMASVPIVESRPLARALYAVCRVDEEIPRELFEGVAMVLAFVHRLKLRPSISGEHLLDIPVSWDPTLSDLDAGPVHRRRRRSRPDPHLGAVTADHPGS